MNNVYPSARARAAFAAAILPPAPGLFSTTTAWPRTFLKWSGKSRAERSALPSAGNGTRTAIVLLGQDQTRAAPSSERPQRGLQRRRHPRSGCGELQTSQFLAGSTQRNPVALK